MKKKKITNNRFILFIQNPPKTFQIIWICFFILCLIATTLLTIFINVVPITIVVYSFTCLSFIYLIYFYKRLHSKNVNSKIKEWINKYVYLKIYNSKYGNKILTSKLVVHNEKKILMYALSTLITLIYAMVLMTLGIVNNSQSYGFLSGYYLLLIAIKLTLIITILKYKNDEKRIHKVKLTTSSLSLILNAIAALYITYIVSFPKKMVDDPILVIVIALYTFYKIIITLVSTFKWKNKGLLETSLKKINIIEILVTMMILQTSMLAYYGADQYLKDILNYVICGVATLLITITVVWMLVDSMVKYLKFKKQNKAIKEIN